MKIGILTFYCSDNYGAMLQAYGLKVFLKSICPDTEIVPYAPFFLVGRHWLIPYCPMKSVKATVYHAWRGMKHNLRTIDADVICQKRRMRSFRRKYLCGSSGVIRTKKGLRKLHFDVYIVGSDQIWNPEITLGLRPEYFGVFGRGTAQRVIAYAASLGGDYLPVQYQEQLRMLLTGVHKISLRESSAIPHIQKLTNREVISAADPVFLLPVSLWEKLAVSPAERRYILIHMTENNPELYRYVMELAEKQHLMVLAVRYQWDRKRDPCQFHTVTSAGPEEFLGYIRYADYVVTNSFHALAFSLIFHRPFLAFSHSSRNARLENLLETCGLKSRMVCQGNVKTKIESPISWEQVEERIGAMRERSALFLKESLGELQ